VPLGKWKIVEALKADSPAIGYASETTWVSLESHLTSELEEAQRKLRELEAELERERASSAVELSEKTEELVQANRMLQLVLDTIPARVFWKDKNSNYLGSNQRFAEDAGRESPAELIGQTDFDLSWGGGSDAKKYRADDHQVIETGVAKLNYEESQTRGTGETTWLTTTKIPLRDRENEIFGVLGTYEDITERKIAEQELEISLAEKEILLKELYHRTKNNMQVIYAMLDLQSSYTDDERTLSVLRDVQSKIHAMGLVHQKLYESSDLSSIDLADYLGDLAGHLMMSLGVFDDRVKLELDLERVAASIDGAIPCGLIVSELLSNAVCHGFPDDASGVVRIRLRAGKSEEIIVEVGDDGVGFASDFDYRESPSMGLQAVRGIVEHQLQGKLGLGAGPGVHWTIRFQSATNAPRV